MRKRKNSEEEESSEMEVDDEEKVENNDESESEEMSEDEDETEDPDLPSSAAQVDNPFLDSFYALSSDDAKLRSKAAQTMLQHCLLSSGANSKDAAYAFRRLLNGICSGRAAARQGNASALSSFLKLAFHLEKMEEIRDESSNPEDTQSLSMLAYVRRRLLTATDPNQTTGKKKGSEERDYHFGRLFGILSIVRSNILITQANTEGFSETKELAAALVKDLAELFWLKRWMREPAAHGITTLLRTFFETNTKEIYEDIGKYLVEEVVIPELLSMSSSGDEGDADHSKLVASFCAEQLGVALFIQSHFDTGGMKFPLNQAILSKETVTLTAQAMSETSTVVQPRTHFAWDSLWCYLARPSEKTSNQSQRKFGDLVLRDRCPGGDDSTREVLELVVRDVVMHRLLGLGLESKSSGKATHERRALALCIVKILVGVPFVSSLSGTSRVVLEGEVLERSVLSAEVVRSLFLDVVCAGSEKKKTSHLLKPLALDILREMSTALLEDDSSLSESRRLTVVQALLGSEIRFDARTKTSTVSDILGLMRPIPGGKETTSFQFLNRYLDGLQSSLITRCANTKDDESSKATGFVELIYGFAKHVLRLQAESPEAQNDLLNFKNSAIDRILKFFFTAAFFNCENVPGTESKTPKKKKGKKARKGGHNLLQIVAQQIKKGGHEGTGIVYSVRSLISARYFSLLAEFVAYATHTSSEHNENKVEKDSTTLAVLSSVCDDWKSLEELGAERYSSATQARDEESIDPGKTLSQIQEMVKISNEALERDPKDTATVSKKRCHTGIAVLGFSLYLHRLSCGESDQDSDDPDTDDENDEEEICNALEGLKEVAEDFMRDHDDEDTNPLRDLAELCANLLSSPLGSGDMGRAASPKLIREAVKFAWLGGLRLASTKATDKHSLLDKSVMETLVQAVGASGLEEEDEEFDDVSDDETNFEEEADSEIDDATEENVFSKAIDVIDQPQNMQVEKAGSSSDESDVELDPTKLQSMLEEDSDADVDNDVLEHHEGADSALAKLIKLKQETRKAGQQAREKIEMAHRLRSTFLLELLFGRFDAWSRVFRTEILSSTLLPMLRLRNKLEKSLNKPIASSIKAGSGEKQALLDRLSTLLTQKICKIKVASLPMAEPLAADVASEFISKILGEMRRADSKEQFSCCSNCFVFLLRSTGGVVSASHLVTTCKEAVVEWSTKRTSKLQASLFDDLIDHIPGLSQRLLLEPLCKASREARSPFLKSESFRLLTLLFSKKSIEMKAEDNPDQVHVIFLAAVEAALKDEEMRKTKRVRVVLKALEKFTAGLSPLSPESRAKLATIWGLLVKFGEGESEGVSAICTKLVGEIEGKMAEPKKAQEKNEEQGDKSTPAAVGEWDVSKSKKKKKKKKTR